MKPGEGPAAGQESHCRRRRFLGTEGACVRAPVPLAPVSRLRPPACPLHVVPEHGCAVAGLLAGWGSSGRGEARSAAGPESPAPATP